MLPNVEEILNSALESPKKVIFEDKRSMTAWRRTAYALRAAARRKSKAVYHPSDPEWDTSPWDELILTVVEGQNQPTLRVGVGDPRVTGVEEA